MDIGTLLDRAAISDLLALYCRGVDRCDEATLRGIYHPDAIEDRGEGLFVGNAQDWVGWTLQLLPAFRHTQHCIMNSLIDIEADTAWGETYFNAYHRFGAPEPRAAAAGVAPAESLAAIEWPAGETELVLAGRYLDRFERRAGSWKIAYRRMVCDWCHAGPAADGWFADNPGAWRGRRSIGDARLPR